MKQYDSSKITETLMKAGILTGLCVSIYLLYYFILPACAAVLRFIGPVLLPFILAGIVAVLVDPVIDFFSHRLRLRRGWAVFVVLTVFISGISAFVVLMSSRLMVELYKLSRNIPDLSRLLVELIGRARSFYFQIDLPLEVMDQMQTVAEKLGTTLTEVVTAALNGTVGFFTALPSTMIMLLITLIATFFLCRDKDQIERYFIKVFPEGWRGRIKSIYIDLSLALVGYFRAEMTLVGLNTLIAIVGLYILGVEYALIMGLLTGFFDVLPVFGPGSVFIPWAIWNLIVGNIKMAVSLGALYVIMIIVRQIMEPKLVAQNLGVHPLATLAAIFIGLKTLGVLGIFLGPAILITVKTVMKAWRAV